MTFRNLLIPCMLVFSLTAGAEPGQWVMSGPEGGNVRGLDVSLDMPERIYLASEGGAFRSDDEGQTWLHISQGLPWRGAWHLMTSDADADRVYHSVGSLLHRSDDGGLTWQQPEPGWGNGQFGIFQLSVDDDDPDLLTMANNWNGLNRSADGGNTWNRIDDDSQFELVTAFVTLPGDANTIVMMAREHDEPLPDLFRTTDGGQTWTSVATHPGVSLVTKLIADPNGRLFSYPQLAYSNDGGANWSSFTLPGISGFVVQFLQVSDNDADTWYLGGSDGLIRTTDGGENFEIISEGMGPAGAEGYNAGVHALALKPGAADTVLVGSEFTGFYRSTNGGETWQRRNSGLFGAYVRSLAVHPANTDIIYAGQGDALSGIAEGLWASFDGGASWSPSNQGLASGGLRGLTIDPNTTSNPLTTTLYAAGGSFGITDVSLPGRPASGGVFKSTSGGGTWSDISADLPTFGQVSLMRAVLLDPASGSGPEGDGPLQTVFAAGNGFLVQVDDGDGGETTEVGRHIIYRSADAGQTWVPSADGIEMFSESDGLHLGVIQMIGDPSDSDTMYASTATVFAPAEGIVPTLNNGVFKTVDGGQSWQHSSSGLPRTDESSLDSTHWNVLALALAPSSPNVLYAAASPLDTFRPGVIHRSNDGGNSWFEVNNGIPDDIDIRWLAVSPGDPDEAYAAGGGTVDNPGSIFRTVDGGQNWVSYSVGMPADAAYALVIDDSGDHPIIYAGTRGGVYSIEQVPDGDIDGVPDEIEDGAPNGGDGNADGIPDSMQEDVASLLAPADALRSTARRGISDYITVELVDKPHNGCNRLMSVHSLAPNSFPMDSGHDYPYGMLRFEIPDCPGATVRIIYHDLDGTGFDDHWRFRIYAPDQPGNVATIRWQDMSGAVRNGNAWTITLEDGQIGDLRPANNRILFQGGPALGPDDGIFSDRFEVEVLQFQN